MLGVFQKKKIFQNFFKMNMNVIFVMIQHFSF